MNINRIKKNIKKVEEIVENIDAQDIINRMEIDKENSIEELEQRLEELYRTQQARLEVGADDLDIREEIAEVEEEIKELQDETIEENSIKNERSSIKEDIKILEEMIENANIENMDMNDCFGGEHIEAIEHILSDYKRVLKENEELEEINNELEAEKNEAIRRYNFETIPKQKVKEKIEELDRKITYIESQYTNGGQNCNSNYLSALYQKQVLQELLESEE